MNSLLVNSVILPLLGKAAKMLLDRGHVFAEDILPIITRASPTRCG